MWQNRAEAIKDDIIYHKRRKEGKIIGSIPIYSIVNNLRDFQSAKADK